MPAPRHKCWRPILPTSRTCANSRYGASISWHCAQCTQILWSVHKYLQMTCDTWRTFPRNCASPYSRYIPLDIPQVWRNLPQVARRLAAPDFPPCSLALGDALVHLVVAHPMNHFPQCSDHPVKSCHQLFG